MGLVMHSPFKDKHTVHAEVGMTRSSAFQGINTKGETTKSDGTTVTFDGDAIQYTTEEDTSCKGKVFTREKEVQKRPHCLPATAQEEAEEDPQHMLLVSNDNVKVKYKQVDVCPDGCLRYR